MGVRLTNKRGVHFNKKITNKRKKSFDLIRDQLIHYEIGPEFKIDFTHIS